MTENKLTGANRVDQGQGGNLMVHGWPLGQCVVSGHDRAVLRELGEKLRSFAERPCEKEKAALWTAHNGLKTEQPVIFIDCENGWNEIFPWAETIRCEGEMAQDWEMWLRKEIHWAETLKDDKVVEAKLYIPYKAVDTGWGIKEEVIGDPTKGQAYVWKSPLAELDEDEFESLDLSTVIKTPEIQIDWEASNRAFELAKEVFDGILDVEFRHKWWWSPDLSLSYANLRGMENMMCDFYDFPDKVHEMMRLFTDGYLAKFDYLEKNHLLPNNCASMYIGSGGTGWTDELHGVPGQVKLMDMWGFNEAQETSEVSPEMVKEFILPYQTELASKFGLNYYGCCEGLDRRWEYVKAAIPRLRRVSVSQWADSAKMSEYLSDQYVYCYKVSPTDIAVPNPDEDYIRRRLNEVLTCCKSHNNRVELLMKDNHTLGRRPENASRWVQIAREEVARVYG